MRPIKENALDVQESLGRPTSIKGMCKSYTKDITTDHIEPQRKNKPLSARQAGCLHVLWDHYPGGILSHKLRAEIHTNNIAQYVRALRMKGLVIHCQEEPCTIDGLPGTVGRYRLDPSSYDMARRMLGVKS